MMGIILRKSEYFELKEGVFYMIQELTIFFVFQTYADSIKGYTEWSRRGAALVE